MLVVSFSMAVICPGIRLNSSHPFDGKPLTGLNGTYRIRQGDWRAVYELVRIDDTLLVIIIDVRGEVYK
jgi:mRNA-degrading endonuclease RelE of RelBE toxin-antitoxin system